MSKLPGLSLIVSKYLGEVDKIRGGPLKVSLEAMFSYKGNRITVCGSGTSELDNDAGIQEAQSKALEHCWVLASEQASDISKVNTTEIVGSNSVEVVRAMLQPHVTEKWKDQVRSMSETGVGNITGLLGDYNQDQQKKVNDFCGVIGVEPIQLGGEQSLSFLEAEVLIELLKKVSSRVTMIGEH